MHKLETYIVEDSPVIRENLIATLEELGPVKVIGSADDEAAALAWLAQTQTHADLVIVDIFLRHGSGLGVLRGAQSLPHGAHMVVLSNYATDDMRQHCLQLGAERVFDKSRDIEGLIAYCDQLAAEPAGRAVPG